MTLQPYDASRLDQLALRVLDISHVFRHMAQRLREEQPEDLALHDKKAHEWLDQLEHWARRSEADLELALIKKRGVTKARQRGRAGR